MQLVITGANGRLAQILRAAWADGSTPGFTPIWSSRLGDGADHTAWDVLSGPAPILAKGCVFLHLAGVLRGDRQTLSANAEMARNVCSAAKSADARHIFVASTAAVYGRATVDHAEDSDPVPMSDYGRAKYDMEREVRRWARDAGPDAPGVTCLRIGNVLGADALFGTPNLGRSTQLDPVHGQPGGPIRSYIGPRSLAEILTGLVLRVMTGAKLPLVLNVAAPHAVAMADLLMAADWPFQFAPPNPNVVPKVSLSTKRLATLVPLQHTTAAEMVGQWRSLLAVAG